MLNLAAMKKKEDAADATYIHTISRTSVLSDDRRAGARTGYQEKTHTLVEQEDDVIDALLYFEVKKSGFHYAKHICKAFAHESGALCLESLQIDPWNVWEKTRGSSQHRLIIERLAGPVKPHALFPVRWTRNCADGHHADGKENLSMMTDWVSLRRSAFHLNDILQTEDIVSTDTGRGFVTTSGQETISSKVIIIIH